jgi:hypothetical protein
LLSLSGFSTIQILNRHVEQMVVERIRKMGTKQKRRNHENRAAKDWGAKPQKLAVQERSAAHRSEEGSTENRQVEQEHRYGKKNGQNPTRIIRSEIISCVKTAETNVMAIR